jgi:hypothetical protein
MAWECKQCIQAFGYCGQSCCSYLGSTNCKHRSSIHFVVFCSGEVILSSLYQPLSFFPVLWYFFFILSSPFFTQFVPLCPFLPSLLTFPSICWVWYWNMENWYAGEWDDQYRGSSGRDQWCVCGAQEWSYIYGSRLSSNPLFFHPFTWASSTLVLFPWKSHSMSESHLCIYEKSV